MTESIYQNNIKNLKKILAYLEKESTQQDLRHWAHICSDCLKAGGKVLFAGNGGSAADAQHLAAEIVGRFQEERPGMAALALTSDTSALTAISNDYGFEMIFARQVEGLGQTGDVFIGITTSGNSKNILKAFEQCRKMGIHTLALTGRDGGKAQMMADHAIVVEHQNTARIQEAHIFLGHCLCELIELDALDQD